MPIADIVSRVNQIETLVARAAAPTSPDVTAFPAALSATTVSATTGVLPTTTAALALQSPYGVMAQPVVTGGTNGANVLAAAQSQVGQSEQPPGSNDGPALAVYRTAVAGSAAGQPWCATFASWAAAQAGVPVGDSGAGSASVEAIAAWAGRTGHLLPSSSTPAPGDMILFGGRHIGIVESVNADGSLTTVEGNHGNAVTRAQRSPSEATGYVRL
jgi:hypothetical protein